MHDGRVPAELGVTWAAPGRVNLIGEHVDYNDGLVLPFAIDRSVTVTLTRRAADRDDALRVTSAGVGATTLPSRLQPGAVAGWERYVAGAVWSFEQETGIHVSGLDVSLTSSLPVGAGLSSSAAVECGVLCALDDVFQTALPRRRVAALALRAERDFVGVPCGPMDQLAVMLGERRHALLLDCRDIATEQIPFDLAAAGLVLLVVDTHVTHAVGDGPYAERRADCDVAARLLDVATLRDASLDDVLAMGDDRLRRRAHHVVTEIQRVRDVSTLLRAGNIRQVGGFLTASHQSLAEDFEVSCPELDLVVDAALAAGALGGRMTGAGFGGSAIVLCRSEDAAPIEAQIIDAFESSGWVRPDVFAASPSAGARFVSDAPAAKPA